MCLRALELQGAKIKYLFSKLHSKGALHLGDLLTHELHDFEIDPARGCIRFGALVSQEFNTF